MAIPAFDEATGYLPAGLHEADLPEIHGALGFSDRRRWFIGSLERVDRDLKGAGVRDLRIDGSFVTAKPDPGDIDGFWVWDPNVDLGAIPPLLLDFSLVPDPRGGEPKFPMWFALGIELFIHPFHLGDDRQGLPAFFSHSRDGEPRGYVRVTGSATAR